MAGLLRLLALFISKLADRRCLLGLGKRLVVAPHQRGKRLEAPLRRRGVGAAAERKRRPYQENANHDSKRHLPKQSLKLPRATGNRAQHVILHSTMSFCAKGGETGLVPPKFAVKVVNWG